MTHSKRVAGSTVSWTRASSSSAAGGCHASGWRGVPVTKSSAGRAASASSTTKEGGSRRSGGVGAEGGVTVAARGGGERGAGTEGGGGGRGVARARTDETRRRRLEPHTALKLDADARAVPVQGVANDTVVQEVEEGVRVVFIGDHPGGHIGKAYRTYDPASRQVAASVHRRITAQEGATGRVWWPGDPSPPIDGEEFHLDIGGPLRRDHRDDLACEGEAVATVRPRVGDQGRRRRQGREGVGRGVAGATADHEGGEEEEAGMGEHGGASTPQGGVPMRGMDLP